jgi:glycogen debranching enzyme
MSRSYLAYCLTAGLFLSLALAAQQPTSAYRFSDGPVLTADANPLKPFTVAGDRGVIVGQQDGTFEAWVNPIKLLSNFRITANVAGYNVPIDVNSHASSIEVRPDRTIITYSHIAFTLREIIFSPAALDDPASAHQPTTGPVILFEFQTLHPTDFIFSFTPEMRWMWPRANNGIPSAEWVSPTGSISNSPLAAGQSNADNTATAALGGYYLLHTDIPELTGALTIPGATPGIMAPYQERPEVHAVELHLHIDPKRDNGKLFPLLMAVGTTKEDATFINLGARLAHLNTQLPTIYNNYAAEWTNRLAHLTTISTPDKELNEAFTWAAISVEQLRTHAFTTANNNTGETGLVAGYFMSADSARPGFGWFFGRDSLYTLYATNSIGDFKLSRDELEFLIARQRADGKIMHEYSQTAPMIDWQSFPYEYAAADATPLFLLATEDYLRTSGDLDFLRKNEAAINLAWNFERTHDTDGDGIYDNSQGTGWVESWPGGMPHQEIYLALLDQQASVAYARIMELLKKTDAATDARKRATAIKATIEREYYDKEKGCYAFSYNAEKGNDRTRTVYSAMAWWSSWSNTPKNSEESNALGLQHGSECLTQLAGHTLDTDWGLRDVASDEPIYDGMSYHQGSVWPLFTGWAALAEYRGGQPIAGYQLLMQNAHLTRISDLGAATELLSGDFNVPFGRSTSHQLWSSAMVITPTLRGLFGIDINAATKTITINPQLPAEWDHAEVKNLQTPNGTIDLLLKRETGKIVVHSSQLKDAWQLRIQ